jgi:hypothetical protein
MTDTGPGNFRVCHDGFFTAGRDGTGASVGVTTGRIMGRIVGNRPGIMWSAAVGVGVGVGIGTRVYNTLMGDAALDDTVAV